VGPVLDSTGVAVTSAVVGDFRLSKNGTVATLSGATVTHDANGYYTIALTAGNTDTTGRLVLTSGNTAQSMASHHWSVLPSSVYDALYTNATNTTGGLATATGTISALAGAISTYAGGAVASVTNRVTANVDQWNGSTVTGMPMPTYTQPTGFLAATFPGTVASPTNITSATGIVLAGVTHTGAVIPTVSDVTTKTGYSLSQSFPSNFASMSVDTSGRVLLQPTQTGVTIPTVTDVTTKTGYTAAVSDKTGFSLLATTGLGNQTANITGNLSGSVGSVTGAVGSISGVTFPANFGLMVINGTTGHTAAVVHSVQAGAYTSAAFAANWLTASGLASDAVAEIVAGVWNEPTSSHTTAGTTGKALIDSGAAGNPWSTDLSTGYSGTQAGSVLNQVKVKTDTITTPTINVYPVAASTPDRVSGTTLTFYRNEARSVSILTDFTLTSMVLLFVVEDNRGNDVYALADGSISRSSQTATVAVTTAVTGSLGQYAWSLRDITGGLNSVVARGVLSVQLAASS
jgi:hypothetical protein